MKKMEEIIKRLLKTANIPEDVCELLIADFMRIALDEKESTSRVTYYSKDPEKREAINYAVSAISYSVKGFIAEKDLDKLIQITSTLSKNIPEHTVVDLDDFNSAKEDEKFEERLDTTRIGLMLTSTRLQSEITGLEEQKSSLEGYESKCVAYRKLMQETDEDITDLEVSTGIFARKKIKKS